MSVEAGEFIYTFLQMMIQTKKNQDIVAFLTKGTLNFILRQEMYWIIFYVLSRSTYIFL